MRNLVALLSSLARSARDVVNCGQDNLVFFVGAPHLQRVDMIFPFSFLDVRAEKSRGLILHPRNLLRIFRAV